jgi:hypothetical protein
MWASEFLSGVIEVAAVLLLRGLLDSRLEPQARSERRAKPGVDWMRRSLARKGSALAYSLSARIQEHWRPARLREYRMKLQRPARSLRAIAWTLATLTAE